MSGGLTPANHHEQTGTGHLLPVKMVKNSCKNAGF
jgi:hypothetical protein